MLFHLASKDKKTFYLSKKQFTQGRKIIPTFVKYNEDNDYNIQILVVAL